LLGDTYIHKFDHKWHFVFVIVVDTIYDKKRMKNLRDPTRGLGFIYRLHLSAIYKWTLLNKKRWAAYLGLHFASPSYFYKTIFGASRFVKRNFKTASGLCNQSSTQFNIIVISHLNFVFVKFEMFQKRHLFLETPNFPASWKYWYSAAKIQFSDIIWRQMTKLLNFLVYLKHPFLIFPTKWSNNSLILKLKQDVSPTQKVVKHV
jgi:hypothetical protein